jgi:hypothetical protein
LGDGGGKRSNTSVHSCSSRKKRSENSSCGCDRSLFYFTERQLIQAKEEHADRVTLLGQSVQEAEPKNDTDALKHQIDQLNEEKRCESDFVGKSSDMQDHA